MPFGRVLISACRLAIEMHSARQPLGSMSIIDANQVLSRHVLQMFTEEAEADVGSE